MLIKQKLGHTLLNLSGWRLGSDAPTIPRYVAVAAPHTSNWDGYHMIVVGLALNLKMQWLGKHTLFRWPFGGIVKRLGGIPVRRSKKMGLVDQVAAYIEKSDQICVFVPPEGTRSRVDTWKSGFYRIAMTANVPIVPTYLDYANRVAAFGEPLHPSGDIAADMKILRAFYQGIAGRYPEKFGEPRLRDEIDPKT